MGFAEVAWALQGQIVEERQGHKILVIDVLNLPAMSQRLKRVRDETALLKKEDTRLKAAILSHADCKIGYKDDGIKVTEALTPDTDDPQLVELLKKKGYWDRVTSVTVSVTALRDVAEEDPEVAEAINWLTSRKLSKQRG